MAMRRRRQQRSASSWAAWEQPLMRSRHLRTSIRHACFSCRGGLCFKEVLPGTDLDPVCMKRILSAALVVALIALSACSRFHNAANDAKEARYVVISPIYNEIIWALGAQDRVVGVDLSTTYPPEVKKVQTVGYHRALSAEGILSLHPTAIIHDGNIGPPNVIQQLQSLNIPMKTFSAKNDSFDGAKTLIREMGAYFHKEARAEELCNTLDAQKV